MVPFNEMAYQRYGVPYSMNVTVHETYTCALIEITEQEFEQLSNTIGVKCILFRGVDEDNNPHYWKADYPCKQRITTTGPLPQ